HRLDHASTAGSIVKTNGLLVALNGNTYTAQLANKNLGWASHINKFVFDDVTFNSGNMIFAGAGGQNFYDQDIPFNRCRFENGSSLTFNKTETAGYSASTAKIVFKECVFDLTVATRIFNNTVALLGAMTIDFIDCTFVSDTPKSLAFIQGQTANITAVATNCRFINVTNTDSILQIAGTAKTTYDPPSLANGVQQSTTVTLTGAKVGDNINVSFDKSLSGTRMWGEVTSANTVTIYHRNDTGAVVDVASGTLTVKLI
ncbi:hypothetical protein, partial [Jeotgalibaca porci]|uniref:hypothetical protein n=1 Tax=Jeotgalibaca porci TaxID=1868793 RepID=UPI0035A0561F